MSRSGQKGYTIPELLIAIGILSILALLASTFYQTFLISNQLDNAASDLADTLRRAQANAMNKENNNSWGVRMLTNQFILFTGSSFNVSDPNNETTNLPPPVTISSINLTGGGSDLIFNKVKGTTSTDGTITLQNTINATATVTITPAGKIERL